MMCLRRENILIKNERWQGFFYKNYVKKNGEKKEKEVMVLTGDVSVMLADEGVVVILAASDVSHRAVGVAEEVLRGGLC